MKTVIAPEVSLIITTYNWHQALALSLKSVLSQTMLPFEIIVADDGSGEATAETIRGIKKEAPVEVIHSWQEDKGFRAAQSRNRAISKAKGNYIILIDGDILLERHFIEDHYSLARQGYFSQGSRVLLGEELSQSILAGKKINISLFSSGVGNKKNCLRSPFFAKLFSLESRRLSGVKTCNFAFWKSDAEQVNGFNEDFVGWGREDSEFAARLMNCGVKRQNIRFSALGYHLHHPVNTRNHLKDNDKILNETVVQNKVWCNKGLDGYRIQGH